LPQKNTHWDEEIRFDSIEKKGEVRRKFEKYKEFKTYM
jgi:hypothetical protein